MFYWAVSSLWCAGLKFVPTTIEFHCSSVSLICDNVSPLVLSISSTNGRKKHKKTAEKLSFLT